MSDAMAKQLAALLADSDLAELEEIVREWRKTAPTERARKTYDEMATRLVELKTELSKAPVQPTREELEIAIATMMTLAAERK